MNKKDIIENFAKYLNIDYKGNKYQLTPQTYMEIFDNEIIVTKKIKTGGDILHTLFTLYHQLASSKSIPHEPLVGVMNTNHIALGMRDKNLDVKTKISFLPQLFVEEMPDTKTIQIHPIVTNPKMQIASRGVLDTGKEIHFSSFEDNNMNLNNTISQIIGSEITEIIPQTQHQPIDENFNIEPGFMYHKKDDNTIHWVFICTYLGMDIKSKAKLHDDYMWSEIDLDTAAPGLEEEIFKYFQDLIKGNTYWSQEELDNLIEE